MDHFMETAVHYVAYTLELVSIIIVAYSAVTTLIKYLMSKFEFTNKQAKIEFSRALEMALAYMLGAEILKSLIAHSKEQLITLGALIILRAAIALIIHFETEADARHCHK
ncbi:MAG: DUF1622 domain-containing protein [Tissierellia bacterium]|nr:DUF1622 domain-containing protein [Tissierellia bacterium]